MSPSENERKEAIIEPDIGDTLQIQITDIKQVSTHVELVQGKTIWAADFLSDIWNYTWRRQAFDVTYMKHERCFSFLAEIEGRDKIDKLPVTRITRISRIQEVQRRASFRLPYSFDVLMRKKCDKDDPNASRQYVQCKGVDISETGIGFTTSENTWKSGDIVQCKFAIEDEEYVFDARIMRRVIWTRDDVFIYNIGIKFHTEDEKQLKKIRRFIFKQQIAHMM